MYRVDIFEPVRIKGKGGKIEIQKKKMSSHWYPSQEEAQKASDAIYRIPYGTHIFVPREGKSPIAVTYGRYSTSKPIIDYTFG